jgi:hypothetical protein
MCVHAPQYRCGVDPIAAKFSGFELNFGEIALVCAAIRLNSARFSAR